MAEIDVPAAPDPDFALVFATLQIFGNIYNVVNLIPRKIRVLPAVNEFSVYKKRVLAVCGYTKYRFPAFPEKRSFEFTVYIFAVSVVEPYPFSLHTTSPNVTDASVKNFILF